MSFSLNCQAGLLLEALEQVNKRFEEHYCSSGAVENQGASVFLPDPDV